MPRRCGTIAVEQARKAHAARWRYLLRNTSFRADINELLFARRTETSASSTAAQDVVLQEILAERKLHKKWGLDAIPGPLREGYQAGPNAKVLPELTAQTVKDWEKGFSEDLFPPFFGLVSAGWG